VTGPERAGERREKESMTNLYCSGVTKCMT
jgi:hypothetical protein